MTDETENGTALELARKNKAITVLESMFMGDSKRDACEKVGISEKGFDLLLVSFPEVLVEFSKLLRARMAKFADDLAHQRVEFMDASAKFTKDLREIVEDDSEDINTRMKAFKMLITADKHTEKVLRYIIPDTILEEQPLEPGVQLPDKTRGAKDIMKNFQGASLRGGELTITIKQGDDPLVIEGSSNNLPDTPAQSDQE